MILDSISQRQFKLDVNRYGLSQVNNVRQLYDLQFKKNTVNINFQTITICSAKIIKFFSYKWTPNNDTAKQQRFHKNDIS